MSRFPLKISLYFILFLLLLISDIAKGLTALLIILTGAYILASFIYRKAFDFSNLDRKDAEGYSQAFKETTEDKRPSRDEITSKYSSDRYSKEEIENFIEEIGELAGDNLSEILEVETVREMPDKGLMELKDMARKDYEPIFDVKKDGEKIVRIRRNFPDEELLEALNEVLEDLKCGKSIFLYRDSKILVLDEEEKGALKSKFGSRFGKI